MAANRKTGKSAFVPRLLVRGAIAGVIPACAVVACGGGETATTDAGASDAGPDRFPLGVAAVAYPAYESGAPEASVDGGALGDAGPDASIQDAAPAPDVFLGVAAVAYPAYESGVPDGAADGAAIGDATTGDASSGVDASIQDASRDVFFGVAYLAYEAGKD